jgi:hypothetical protein
VGEEGFELELAPDLVVVERQGLCILAATINHSRDFFLATQAAARTFPHVLARLRLQRELDVTTHGSTLSTLREKPRPSPMEEAVAATATSDDCWKSYVQPFGAGRRLAPFGRKPAYGRR